MQYSALYMLAMFQNTLTRVLIFVYFSSNRTEIGLHRCVLRCVASLQWRGLTPLVVPAPQQRQARSRTSTQALYKLASTKLSHSLAERRMDMLPLCLDAAVCALHCPCSICPRHGAGAGAWVPIHLIWEMDQLSLSAPPVPY
jgi:hypothetical protein